MGRTKEAPERHDRAARALQAHTLRRQGLRMTEIAVELNVSEPTVRRDLRHHRELLIEQTQDVAGTIREEVAAGARDVIDEGWRILHRYEDRDDQTGVPVDAKAAQALRSVLAGYERLAKLYGADAPLKVEASVAGDMTDDEAAKILEQAAQTTDTA